MAPPARRGSASRTGRGKTIAETSAPVPGRGGRPSRKQSEEIRQRILDAATHLFLTLGYGATSIDAVAQRARISKRTFYHRFDDKSALFTAVVHCIIDRLRPPADVPLIAGGNLEEVLQRLAGLILRGTLSKQAIALHRLVVGESARFPDLAAVVAREVTTEGLRLIVGLLELEAKVGNLKLDNPGFAAEEFLHMVIGVPQRRAMGFGVPMTGAELDAWVRNAVNLFLNGSRGWVRASRRRSPVRTSQ
jgi:TetR/AcrR family transcriptional regulator, mexJK operon transcriptional repressor